MKFSKIKLQMIQEQSFNYNSRTIKSATDIVKVVNEIEELEKATEENAFIICLDIKNHIVAYSQIAKGTISTCDIDIKSIFKIILLSNATKFILVHNHPSGDTFASLKDKQLTIHIKQASKIMNIEFLDHIIIGENQFVSCMYKN